MTRMHLVLVVVVATLAGAPCASAQPAPRPGMTPPRADAAPPTGAARIRGRVVTMDTGSALRRAQVRIFGIDAALRRSVTTDADGRYEFAALPPGRYTVTAARGGYVTLEFGQRRAFEPGRPITLAEGQTVNGVDLALPRGSVIVARVTDEFGEPLAFAQVQALRYRYGPGGRRELISTDRPFATDDLGQVRLFGLMPGEYIVSATARPAVPMAAGPGSETDANESYPPTYYPATLNPADAQPVSLAIGQEALLHIGLTAARLARVSGVVVDARGRPSTSGLVTLRSRPALVGMNASGGQIGPDGRFAISNVPPGEYMLDVRSNARVSGVAESASVPITVADGDVADITITTSGGATVRGRVVFEGTPPRTAAEIGQLRVVARSTDPDALGAGSQADSDGRVAPDGTFAVGGIVGEVTFRVLTGPARTTKSVTLDGDDVMETPVRFGGTERIDGIRVVVTDRLTEITGAVTDDRDRPLDDFVVVVLPSDPKPAGGGGRYTRAIRPNQEGKYAIRALPPGRYVIGAVESLEEGQEWSPLIQARIRDYGTPVTLTEGEVQTLNLRLLAGP